MIRIKQDQTNINWLVSAICSFYFLVFAVIALNRFYQFESWYYDFGIFSQAIYRVSRFEAPIIDHFVMSDKWIFADHFSPIIFGLVPLYWLSDHFEIILVAQAGVVAVSGFLAWVLAGKILGGKSLTRQLQAVAFFLVYLSFIGLHNALIAEFHPLTLLPPILLAFFLAKQMGSWRWLVVSAIAVLLVKESTFIIPVWFLGWWGWREAIKTTRKKYLALAGLCLLYGLVVIKWVIPYFAGGDYQYLIKGVNTGGGTNAAGLLKFGFLNLIKTFFTPLKTKTMILSLASFGFLPLLAPFALVPVVINWLSRFMVSGSTRYDLGLHYNAEIAPILFYGMVLGYVFLRDKIAKLKLVILRQFIFWLPSGIALLSVFLSVVYFKTPALLFINTAFYAHSDDFGFLEDLVARVPVEGVVMAQHNLATRFIDRQVYILRENYAAFRPDYIVVDWRLGQSPNNFLNAGDPKKLRAKIENDPNYEIFYDGGQQMIYRKMRRN